MSIAQFIDHTVLKQTSGISDIEKACKEARAHGFAAVCIPPVYVRAAAELLKDTDVKLATVVGFPFGYHAISTKLEEASQAIADGANEIDLVMNLAAFKNGDEEHLKAEINAVVAASKGKALVKVIIESGILSDEEIIACCRLYSEYNIAFLKTSTGYAEKGASLEAVQLMRRHLPEHIQIKASGGIRTFEFASQLIRAGATRLGCSASVAIINGETSNSSY